MTGRFEVRGADEALRRANRAAMGAGARALEDGAEHVLQEASMTVPFDTGALADTGATDVDRAGLVASVYYSTAYAARQHEEDAWGHAPGRRGAWLEATLVEQQDAVLAHMAESMRAALR